MNNQQSNAPFSFRYRPLPRESETTSNHNRAGLPLCDHYGDTSPHVELTIRIRSGYLHAGTLERLLEGLAKDSTLACCTVIVY